MRGESHVLGEIDWSVPAMYFAARRPFIEDRMSGEEGYIDEAAMGA